MERTFLPVFRITIGILASVSGGVSIADVSLCVENGVKVFSNSPCKGGVTPTFTVNVPTPEPVAPKAKVNTGPTRIVTITTLEQAISAPKSIGNQAAVAPQHPGISAPGTLDERNSTVEASLPIIVGPGTYATKSAQSNPVVTSSQYSYSSTATRAATKQGSANHQQQVISAPVGSNAQRPNTDTLRPNAFGPGIHANQYGQPVTVAPDFGGQAGEQLQLKQNAYGPGIHMDQYGRPVREFPR